MALISLGVTWDSPALTAGASQVFGSGRPVSAQFCFPLGEVGRAAGGHGRVRRGLSLWPGIRVGLGLAAGLDHQVGCALGVGGGA